MKKNSIPVQPVKYTIGVDVGDVRHNIYVLDRAGNVIDEREITNHKESLISPSH